MPSRGPKILAMLGLPAFGLAGCGFYPPLQREAPAPVGAHQAESVEGIPTDWRTVVTPVDRNRLARLGQNWTAALADARRRGFASRIAQEGSLLQPNGALSRPSPPPGPYSCRTIRLGGSPAYRAYPAYSCYVETEGAFLILDKQTGSERPAGRMWKDGDGRRLVFLGALERGAEAAPPAYGARADRDLAGVVQRVGPSRWRLVIPGLRPGPSLDVLELVPAS